jgi:hypothetical protein
LGVSRAFYYLLLAIDTSKAFGYFVMQDINKKEGFSHPFFLNLLGLFGQGLSACPVLKSVSWMF